MQNKSQVRCKNMARNKQSLTKTDFFNVQQSKPHYSKKKTKKGHVTLYVATQNCNNCNAISGITNEKLKLKTFIQFCIVLHKTISGWLATFYPKIPDR